LSVCVESLRVIAETFQAAKKLNDGDMLITDTKLDKYETHTHTTIIRPFFQYHPGEPVPEDYFWTLWCKGRLTDADTLTIRLGATPSGPTSALLHHPHIFYRPDALPAA